MIDSNQASVLGWQDQICLSCLVHLQWFEFDFEYYLLFLSLFVILINRLFIDLDFYLDLRLCCLMFKGASKYSMIATRKIFVILRLWWNWPHFDDQQGARNRWIWN